jgi:hypothetical protein
VFYPEEEHEPRTQHVEDSAREAEANGTTVYGVKGKSMLSSQIDISGHRLHACCSRRYHGIIAFPLS